MVEKSKEEGVVARHRISKRATTGRGGVVEKLKADEQQMKGPNMQAAG
jgi:hypothetical protein